MFSLHIPWQRRNLCPTSQVLNFLPLLITLLQEAENIIPAKLNYTDAIICERRISLPRVMKFRNFLFNILPNVLNHFQTELDCHPNSLRKHWVLIPCIKDQIKLSEVLGLLPILTIDAGKEQSFL